MEKHVRQKGRFLGFAGGHFVVSAVSLVIWLLSNVWGGFSLWAVGAALTLLYLPAGTAAGVLLKWSWPTPKEWGKSVLWAAAAAWIWGFGGWIGLCLGVAADQAALAYLCFWVLLFAVYLATPSFLMMLGTLSVLHHLPTTWDPLWCGAILLAGFLPGLLFHLGALAGVVLRRGRTAGVPGEGGNTHVL